MLVEINVGLGTRVWNGKYIENCLAHLALGDYEKAEYHADKALGRHQKSRKAISAWSCKGFIAYTKKNYSDSFSYYSKAKAIAEPYRKKAKNPKDIENFSFIWHMLGAVSYCRNEKVYYLDDALRYFRDASNMNKKNAMPLLMMADVFLLEKYYNKENADAKIAEALKADSNLVYASWIDKGVGLEKDGKYDEAIEYFDKAITPDSCYRSLSKINKGLVSLKQKDYRNAKVYFDSALDEESNYSALALIGKCFLLGKSNELQEAKNCFDKARKSDNDLECEKSKDLIYHSLSEYKFFFNGYDIDFVRDLVNECREIVKDSNYKYTISPIGATTNFTASEYVSAFHNLPIAPHKKQMLLANYYAPNRTLTATMMAKAMGYDNFNAANLHYGMLGGLVGEKLGWNPLPEFKVNVLVDFKKEDNWLWIMKPAVAEAIKLLGWNEDESTIPEEIDEIKPIYEGAMRRVSVNAYERSAVARAECLRHYGCKCTVCGAKLSDAYGEVAQGYIHIHHLRQLAEINSEYRVDPIADLRPVCPTCHSIIHLRKPPYSIEDVQKMIELQRFG